MFVPAPRQFSLSEETKASIKLDGNLDGVEPSRTPRAALLRAARKAREQISSQWLDFQPGHPVLAKKRYFDVHTDGWAEEQVMVQLDSKAFGEGAVRECFRMKEVRLESKEFAGHAAGTKPKVDCKAEKDIEKSEQSKEKTETHLCFEAIACGLMELPRNSRRTLWVAKRSIADHHRKIMHRRECETDVIHQTFAKHYAELFNQEVHRHAVESGLGRCGAHDIDFLLTHVVELPEKVTYSAEAFVLGEYRKHNTNGGSTMGPRTTPQAFSYFTFIKSGRRLMIVDIQGVLDLYTDPVIHFLPSRVSGKLAGADMELNFAIKGFALFLWSHRRNDIDQLLNLPIFALSQHEEKHLAPSNSRTVSQLISSSKDNPAEAQDPGDFVVNLAEIPGVDLSDWCNWRGAVRHHTCDRVDRMPEDLVEAECHMEIAALYHQGRITLRDELRGPPGKKEVESAVFHVVEAARQDLPEALLALARLCSGEEHDFLPQVKGFQPETMRALLARAATLGARHAMAALADLVLRDSSASTEEVQLACDHLQAFAEDILEELRTKAAMAEEESEEEDEDEEDEDEEEVDQEHNSLHKKNFGWDAHGYDAPSALRRAAELFEGLLAEVPQAASQAASLRKRSEAAASGKAAVV